MKTRRAAFVCQDGIGVFHFILWLCVIGFLSIVLQSRCMGISSKITRQKSGVDFSESEVKDVVVGSQGTIELGRAADKLVEKFENVWSVNAIVVNGGTVYVGTSPNGGIYEYALGKLKKIYSAETRQTQELEQQQAQPEDVSEEPQEVEDANIVEQPEHLANEHIFAMAFDVSGRLLAGISGDSCKLLRLESGRMLTVFEPEDAKYIFAITVDDEGSIYLGTGPKGRIYRLDSFGKNAEEIYDSLDKNILSLAVGGDGFIYAGSDSRGLVYKIDPEEKKAAVLYDSGQDEVTGLLFLKGEEYLKIFGKAESDDGSGVLYAAATSAEVVAAHGKYTTQMPLAGRPEVKGKKGTSSETDKGGLKLNIANTKKGDDAQALKTVGLPGKLAKPEKTSYIYKISKDGYVTSIFDRALVFFSLALYDKELLIGTGNSAKLYSVDPLTEQEKIIYSDEQASQITAVVVSGEDIYIGTSNPAKLIKLGKSFAAVGNYTSALIDAGQPAKWGKLQIEADIPSGCKILVSSRSGNVKDVNDPTFSQWAEPMEITGPIQLRCPVGRFCQYRLQLESEDGRKSPLVREVAVASTVPNLAPKVKEVDISRTEKSGGDRGVFKISYKAEDDNADKLIYRIDFRKTGRENWIELKEKIEENSFEWDGRTVEDGRYEVRVTASDERSNSSASRLTDSRITEPLVVDNTGPVIEKSLITQSDGKTITLKLRVSDKLSVIGEVNYTIDSNAEWRSAVPDDLVYDTTDERFTIKTEKLQPGEHIISVKISDDVGNVTYKTYEVSMPGE